MLPRDSDGNGSSELAAASGGASSELSVAFEMQATSEPCGYPFTPKLATVQSRQHLLMRSASACRPLVSLPWLRGPYNALVTGVKQNRH